jgi:hypothetical protein
MTPKSFSLLNAGKAALLALTLCRQTASAAADTNLNTLTPEEKAAGWQLLFNGTNFAGWHNFHSTQIAPGWVVTNGLLICAQPETAGDIVTSAQYGWFELQLDYNISEGGNSGVLYHVTGENTIPRMPTWYTGPEFQLLDNVNGRDAEPRQMSGWLYGLYQPPIDPKTGKPLDTTKPVGQWNHIRLLVSQERCEHDMNGVKYFEYVLHSADFNARVAKSKFSQMPPFAKSDVGAIALQGDHGAVMFRNIKIRPITTK